MFWETWLGLNTPTLQHSITPMFSSTFANLVHSKLMIKIQLHRGNEIWVFTLYSF